MAGRVLLLGLAISVSVLMFCGCNPSIENGTAEPLSPAQKRAQLLSQLKQRFDDPATHVKVGRSFQAERLYDKAEWHYRNAYSFDPVYWPAQAAIVKLLQERGQQSEADVAAELFKAKVARSVENSLNLGDALNEARVDDYAVACYAQALRLDAKSAQAHKKLGFYYYDRGDNVRAKEYFKQSYNLDWNQPDIARILGELLVPIELQTRNRSKNTSAGGG